MTWNWVDVIALILVLRGAYVGYRDGLSVEFVKLGTVLITYYCAIKYYTKVALWIGEHSRIQMDWATVVAFLTIAVASLVVVWLFFRLLGKIVSLQFESRISTFGGLLVGAGRAVVVSALFLFSLFFIPDAFVKKQVYSNSFWGRMAIDATPKFYKRVSLFIKEAEQSSKTMSAHYEEEKQRMNSTAREIPEVKADGAAGKEGKP